MDFTNLKEILTNGREMVITLSGTISKFVPFEAEKIAGLIVLILSFWLASAILNVFKGDLMSKLLGTGVLFYILWLW